MDRHSSIISANVFGNSMRAIDLIKDGYKPRSENEIFYSIEYKNGTKEYGFLEKTDEIDDFIKNNFFTGCNGVALIEWDNEWNVVFNEAAILGDISFKMSKGEFDKFHENIGKDVINDKNVIEYHTIVDILKQMYEGDLINIYNNYAMANNYEYIYSTGCIEDYLSSKVAIELVRSGSINLHDRWYTIDGYGKFHSFNTVDSQYSPICIDDIAKYIIDTGDSLESDKLLQTLEEIEEPDFEPV